MTNTNMDFTLYAMYDKGVDNCRLLQHSNRELDRKRVFFLQNKKRPSGTSERVR